MSQSQMHLEQYQNLKVLVLDDDRMSAHNLSIQLKFVGETPMLSTSENWLQVLRMLTDRGESSYLLAIALGQIRKCNLVDLLLSLHRHSPHLPLLLLSDLEEGQLSQLPHTLQEKLLPLGDASLNYQNLLNGLQTARRMSGRLPETVSRSNIDGPSALFRSLSGESPEIQRIRQLIQVVAQRQVTVLVTGESGTGKEVVARNLHYHSGRTDRPFIAVNCAAIAPDRQGAELFGQQRNFNGVRADLSGLVEQAEGGTLFLDEIAEMPLQIQALLLRFLEDRTFQRVGGHEYQMSDVRIVAATRQNLEQKIHSGHFREDLYYRLGVMPIALPPLRERREDIPELVRELTTALEHRDHMSVRFGSAALRSLQQHSWPGNVRELANLVERMAILLPNTVVGLTELPYSYRHEVDAWDVNGGDPSLGVTAGRNPADRQTLAELAELGLAPAGQQAAAMQASEPDATVSGQSVVNAGDDEEANGSLAEMPAQAGEAAAGQDYQPEQETGLEHDGQTEHDAQPEDDIQPEHDMQAESASARSAAESPAARPGFASLLDSQYMQPLSEERLAAYLTRFERQLLEVALHDCAGLVDFTAGRLRMDADALRFRMQQHGLNEVAYR